MSVEIAAVQEEAATGAVARVFADIRATMHTGSVNLIWRHLATLDGALEPLWLAVKPIYAGDALERSIGALKSSIAPPAAWSAQETQNAGLDDEARRLCGEVIATYNRGNALNLMSLSALLTQEDRGAGVWDGEPEVFPSPSCPLPLVPELDSLDPITREWVFTLNAYGMSDARSSVVATLYKHIAIWPEFLPLVAKELEPLSVSGTLQQESARFVATARAAAGELARQRGPLPDTEAVKLGLAMMEQFVELAISRMLPIGLYLRARLALP